MTAARSVEELRTLLEQAVHEVHHLTTLLDESPAAEQQEKLVHDLHEARARVVELERELQEAESAD